MTGEVTLIVGVVQSDSGGDERPILALLPALTVLQSATELLYSPMQYFSIGFTSDLCTVVQQ